MLVMDHVGYAVENIEQYLDSYVIPLLQPRHVSEVVEDPHQQARLAFATLQDGTRIELIQPLGESSPAYRRVRERRGGIYHVCYLTDDLEQTIAAFRKRRCLCVVKPVPAVAFGGRRVAFMYTPQADLIEFVESEQAHVA